MRAPGHGGIPRHRVLRRDRGDAVPGAERDGEQEREFTQGGWSSSDEDEDEDDAMMTSGGVCVRRALSLGFPWGRRRRSASKTRASSVADYARRDARGAKFKFNSSP